MLFDRIIRPGDSSDACYYIKQRLLALGYYSPEVTAITSDTYDEETGHAVIAFQAQNNDKNGRPLVQDGIIGALTWDAIENEYKVMQAGNGSIWHRDLSYGSMGPDVLELKQRLYAAHILLAKPTHSEFRSDTRNAVQELQRVAGLPVNGIVDQATWDALAGYADYPMIAEPVEDYDIPENIGRVARAAILKDLKKLVSRERVEFVLLLLQYAYDPATGPRDFPLSLYVRGGNLYNKQLQPEIATASSINSIAKNKPSYFTDGRKEMMLAAVQASPAITGADCSGGIVGGMRCLDYCKPSFDTTANNLTGNSHSTSVAKASLIPADWVGFDGHIGTYVGGGYVVEWAGGAYGCQLTKLDKRELYCFVNSPDGKTYKKGTMKSATKWTRFRRPKANYYV